MHVRELPHKVNGLPIVKATFLGWLGQHGPLSISPGPGYYAAALTHDHKAGPERSFRVHLMYAAGLDKPWKVAESHEGLNNGTGSVTFSKYEELAEWPETVGR